MTRKAFRVCTLAPLSPPRKGVPLRLARSPRRRLAPASGNIIGMRAVALGGRFLASRPKKPHWGFFPSLLYRQPRRSHFRGCTRSGCAPAPAAGWRCPPLGEPPFFLQCGKNGAARAPYLAARALQAPAVGPPLAPPFCRSRSASGGLVPSPPCGGLRHRWSRSSPPRRLNAAPIVAGWRVRVKPCFSPLPPPSPQGEGARCPHGQASCSSVRLSSCTKSSQGVYPSLSMKTPAS